MSKPATLTREHVLRLVDNEDVAFRFRGSTTIYHVWLSEHERRPTTRAERGAITAMVADGTLKHMHAIGAFGRGVMERVR